MVRRGGSILRVGRWQALLSAVFALMAAASDVSAQSASDKAREVFRTGLALEAAGDWAGALVRFREVSALRPTPQVRFHMARCQEHLGKWVEALGTYRLTIGEAEAMKADDVRREAEAARVALEARVPTLLLRRGPGAEAVIVRLDGVELGETSMGQPMSVDPGPHTLELLVRRTLAGERVVTLGEGERREVELTLDSAAKHDGELAERGPRPGPGQTLPPGSAAQPSAEATSRTGAYVLLGAGGLAAASAAVLFGLRQGTLSDLNDRCVDGRCPRSMEATSDRGKLYTWLGAGSAVVAAGALGAGAVLMLRGSSPSERGGLSLRVSPSPSQLLTASGAF